MAQHNPALILILLTAPFAAGAQAPVQDRVVAYVPTAQVTASGVLAVSGDRSLLGGASVVTALDLPAHLTLARGGEILVCQTSITQLTSGASLKAAAGQDTPLLISLNRGALELHMPISADDAFMTTDLRFTAADARSKTLPLDLAVRVAPDGDTCVENRGKKAPTLQITDTFGQAAYLLKPGQHVLFVHGSLTEVVDHESSPCGCPPPQTLSLADAAVRGGSGKPVTQKQLDKAYPFPAAVSEGLAPPSPLPPDKSGEVHTQVASALAYDAAEPAASDPLNDPAAAARPAAHPAAGIPAPAAAATPPVPSATPELKTGIFHSIGHFFQRIFAR